MRSTQGLTELMRIPGALALYKREAFDEDAEFWMTVSARAYIMGRRVMSTPDEDLKTELYSLMASPSFHNSSRFSTVMFQQATPNNGIVYKLAEIRVMFAMSTRSPRNRRGDKPMCQPPPPTKYALVRLYDRYRPSLSPHARADEFRAYTADYGARLETWQPTADEDKGVTGCMKLLLLPPWALCVIPLSCILQTVHVVQDFQACRADRFLLNRWYWRNTR